MRKMLITHCDSNMSDCAIMMLKSLAKCCDAHVYFYGCGVDDNIKNIIISSYPNITYYELAPEYFIGRIAVAKIECVYNTVKYEGNTDSQIIACDVDMLMKHDPFALFENEGDVYVTRRPAEWKHSINGGLWAFKNNDKGARFIEFYKDQVVSKSWEPYRKYLKKYDHLGEINWRVGQDFLNVIAITDLPFVCAVKIISSRWNWLHDSGAKKKVNPTRQAEQDLLFNRAKKAYWRALNDPTIHVLHFKARMKTEMGHYAKKMEI
jgi:hypothetical protein